MEYDLAPALCEDTLTLPFTKLMADSEQAHICYLRQLFIRESKFDAFTPGATCVSSTLDQRSGNPLLRGLAGAYNQCISEASQIVARDRVGVLT